MGGDEEFLGWGDIGMTSIFHSPCPRAVTDSINQLITMCTQQAPGQKECDNALRELEVGPLPLGVGGRGVLRATGVEDIHGLRWK